VFVNILSFYYNKRTIIIERYIQALFLGIVTVSSYTVKILKILWTLKFCTVRVCRVTRYLHAQRRKPKIKKEDKALQRRTQKKTPYSRKIHRLAFVQAKCKTYKLQVLWRNKTVNRQLQLQCSYSMMTFHIYHKMRLCAAAHCSQKHSLGVTAWKSMQDSFLRLYFVRRIPLTESTDSLFLSFVHCLHVSCDQKICIFSYWRQ